MRVIVVVLAFGWASTWWWYVELDRRYMNHLLMEKMVFQAQNEVLVEHANAINAQTDLIVRLAKDHHDPK